MKLIVTLSRVFTKKSVNIPIVLERTTYFQLLPDSSSSMTGWQDQILLDRLNGKLQGT